MLVLHFNEADQILCIDNTGGISFQNLAFESYRVIQEKKLPRNLRILEHATAFLINSDVDRLKTLKDKLLENTLHFDSVKHAIVTSDPAVTAYVMMVKLYLGNSNYTLEVFSNNEAANHWLLS